MRMAAKSERSTAGAAGGDYAVNGIGALGEEGEDEGGCAVYHVGDHVTTGEGVEVRGGRGCGRGGIFEDAGIVMEEWDIEVRPQSIRVTVVGVVVGDEVEEERIKERWWRISSSVVSQVPRSTMLGMIVFWCRGYGCNCD